MNESFSTTNPTRRLTFPLSNPANIAEALLTQTLTACAEHMGLQSAEAVVGLLLRGDAVVHRCYKQALACHVAEYLSMLDDDIRAVYGYECACGVASHAPHERQIGLSLHLVVWTRRRTAAFISMLAALDRALVQAISDYSGAKNVARVLNVHVIDDADVRNQTGYAALLFAPHQKPVQVWKRKHQDPYSL